MSPSRYRFLGVDINMSFIMYDIGTIESVSVMFELDLWGSFFFVVSHVPKKNSSSESQKKKPARRAEFRCFCALNMQICDCTGLYTCFDCHRWFNIRQWAGLREVVLVEMVKGLLTQSR